MQHSTSQSTRVNLRRKCSKYQRIKFSVVRAITFNTYLDSVLDLLANKSTCSILKTLILIIVLWLVITEKMSLKVLNKIWQIVWIVKLIIN